ncbi:uncharacterized protein JCM10292_002133 [Rhodotorula paludigena]|uniref:uncharacterized protein n=1 Tax=Rhodotorula paludigena TaxID=86838 RepID=UPI003180EE11
MLLLSDLPDDVLRLIFEQLAPVQPSQSESPGVSIGRRDLGRALAGTCKRFVPFGLELVWRRVDINARLNEELVGRIIGSETVGERIQYLSLTCLWDSAYALVAGDLPALLPKLPNLRALVVKRMPQIAELLLGGLVKAEKTLPLVSLDIDARLASSATLPSAIFRALPHLRQLRSIHLDLDIDLADTDSALPIETAPISPEELKLVLTSKSTGAREATIVKSILTEVRLSDLRSLSVELSAAAFSALCDGLHRAAMLQTVEVYVHIKHLTSYLKMLCLTLPRLEHLRKLVFVQVHAVDPLPVALTSPLGRFFSSSLPLSVESVQLNVDFQISQHRSEFRDMLDDRIKQGGALRRWESLERCRAGDSTAIRRVVWVRKVDEQGRQCFVEV